MNATEPSVEERILRAVKLTLAGVIRDTATPPGMRHPLSAETIEDLRQCLALISARERELAEAAGRPMQARPRVGPPNPADPQVVRIHKREDKDGQPDPPGGNT